MASCGFGVAPDSGFGRRRTKARGLTWRSTRNAKIGPGADECEAQDVHGLVLGPHGTLASLPPARGFGWRERLGPLTSRKRQRLALRLFACLLRDLLCPRDFFLGNITEGTLVKKVQTGRCCKIHTMYYKNSMDLWFTISCTYELLHNWGRPNSVKTVKKIAQFALGDML